MSRFWTYLWDVFGHWQAYASGGGVTALVLVYERLFGQIPRRVFVWIVLIFFVVAATFAAWSDAYLSMKGREADLLNSKIELTKQTRPILAGKLEQLIIGPAALLSG